MQVFIMEVMRFRCVVMLCCCLMCGIVLMESAREETVVSNNSSRKVVAITFDDGPHYRNTLELLEELRKRNVKASFFLVGERIPGNEDIVLMMYRDGHVIGNHTYSHQKLTVIPEENVIEEVLETNKIIRSITGHDVEYIRPPCGSWSDELLYVVDMTPVFWDVDPRDWCTRNVNEIVENVVSNVEDGDIILFHDIYESSVVAALEVIDRLSDRGYVFVTISEIVP